MGFAGKRTGRQGTSVLRGDWRQSGVFGAFNCLVAWAAIVPRRVGSAWMRCAVGELEEDRAAHT